ncbi:GspE/PulE family protein [Nocardioides rubriscoriae]|uniref:GspE/PulE family protein n=1 Tax=Nocardioides rubriscoriae TaxID=642762 RepID=UPI001FE8F176|nr:GspE/PulE family protein [Nocardioides rubriscoriae]
MTLTTMSTASGASGPDRSASVLNLLGHGKLTEEQVAAAELVALEKQQPLLNVLVASGAITKVDAVRANSEVLGMEFVELIDYAIDAGAQTRLTGDICRRRNVIPLCWDGPRLVVAASASAARDLNLKDDLKRMARADIKFAIAMKEDIAAKVNRCYRPDGELDQLASDLSDDDDTDDGGLAALGDITAEAPVVRFVNLLVNQGIADGASDIHLDPGEHSLRVRYRIDGVLKDAHTAPKSIQAAVISRLKITAGIDIAETRKPQDGRLSVVHEGKKIDLRVACLPTVFGEKVVMRILDNSTAQMSLDDLGFSPANFQRYRESYEKPYGMILVTGPTGSGKSTTLYATVNIVSDPQVNVITVENPVEYRIPGINQVQTNDKAGMTFAAALKSILRSDPDVVLIGEIRDHETAQIAVEAALTGHLVLSTLHTNDAPSAITRLVEMGIEPFLVGSALDCVLAQRLCRKLCSKCREEYVPTAEELLAIPDFPYNEGDPLPMLYRPVGCNFCSTTGYKGRMALHEVMTVSESVERLAVQRVASDDVMRLARSEGMKTLLEDGWLKVGQGLTSIQEILRVVAT